MLSSLAIILIVLAFLVIASLAFYAGKLLKQVKQQTLRQEQAKAEQQVALQKHDNKILDSVVIIVRAMKEDQCDLSEGCWRLSVLLDSLKTVDGLSAKFPAIFELYDEIKAMPIMEARKKLEKRERMKLDLQRMKAESRLVDAIKQELIQLHSFANGLIQKESNTLSPLH